MAFVLSRKESVGFLGSEKCSGVRTEGIYLEM